MTKSKKRGRRKSRHRRSVSAQRREATNDDNARTIHDKQQQSLDTIPSDSNVSPPATATKSTSVSGKRKGVDRESFGDASTVDLASSARVNETDGSTTSKPTKQKRRRLKSNVSLPGPLYDESQQGSSNDLSGAQNSVIANESVVAQPDFPFPVDPDDHCESPLEAYRDVSPLLSYIRKGYDSRNISHSVSTAQDGDDDWCIYDPYYCDGAVIRNLSVLGFANVYNRKEDCYKVWQTGSLPPFDVLVTNPPYSENHIERLVRFITSSQFHHRPWFLLLPTWVHKKDYYIQATKHIAPFYLVPYPDRRYVYVPPPHFRAAKKSHVHQKSSPFVSMWYCWGGTTQRNNQLIQEYYRLIQEQQRKGGGTHGERTRNDRADSIGIACDLARSKSALRDLRRKAR